MAESKGVTAKQSEQNRTPVQQNVQPRGSADWYGSGPFSMMRRMADEMDRAFDRLFDDFGGRGLSSRGLSGSSQLGSSMWAPRIEAYQEEDRFVVRAELPGLRREDLDVNVTDEAITIQGQRRQERNDQRGGFYHTEMSYGSFHRTIPVPEGAIADSADACFKDGLLEITLQTPPRREQSRGRKIEIKDQPAKQSGQPQK